MKPQRGSLLTVCLAHHASSSDGGAAKTVHEYCTITESELKS